MTIAQFNTPSYFKYFQENCNRKNSYDNFNTIMLKVGANAIFNDILSSTLLSYKCQIISIYYIVFAFSNDSDYIFFNKPYSVIKNDIMDFIKMTLFEKDVTLNLEDVEFSVSELNQEFISARDKYLKFQKDSSFYDLMTAIVMKDTINKRALSSRTSNAKDFVLETKNLVDNGYKLEETIQLLSKDISKRYMNINELSKQVKIEKINKDSAESLLEEYMKTS